MHIHFRCFPYRIPNAAHTHWIKNLAPLRQCIRDKFEEMRGVDFGLTNVAYSGLYLTRRGVFAYLIFGYYSDQNFCFSLQEYSPVTGQTVFVALVFATSYQWFDVGMIIDKVGLGLSVPRFFGKIYFFLATLAIPCCETPNRILGVPVKDSDISTYASAPAPFGSFPPPKEVRIRLGEVFGPESRCLLDFVKAKNELPLYAVFSVKESVNITPAGWVCLMSEECSVVRIRDVDASKLVQSDRAFEAECGATFLSC